MEASEVVQSVGYRFVGAGLGWRAAMAMAMAEVSRL
jgi:hypothetical protein